MLIKNKNFSRSKLSNLIVNNGDIFESCNFAQEKFHTKICEGYTNLIFKDCNLFNCIVPSDATVENCLIIQKDCCSHLHPTWTTLTVCSDNCKHVVDIDEVWIDGILVDKIYYYEDKVVD